MVLELYQKLDEKKETTKKKKKKNKKSYDMTFCMIGKFSTIGRIHCEATNYSK